MVLRDNELWPWCNELGMGLWNKKSGVRFLSDHGGVRKGIRPKMLMYHTCKQICWTVLIRWSKNPSINKVSHRVSQGKEAINKRDWVYALILRDFETSSWYSELFDHLAYHDWRLIPLATVIYAFISSTDCIHTGKSIHNHKLRSHFLIGRADTVFFKQRSHILTVPLISLRYGVGSAQRSQALIQNLLMDRIGSEFNLENTFLKAGWNA